MKLRLHQFLSKTGLFQSKYDLIEAIKKKEITIGGRIVTDPQFQFNPNSRKALWKGKELSMKKQERYFIVNKPVGYLSSKLTDKDKELGKKSVFELLKIDDTLLNTLFCVGRLDEDTTGLLIITNDGKLGHRITDPDNNIEKVYHAVLEKEVTNDDIAKLEEGVKINLTEGKYRTKECSITRIGKEEIMVSIREGKKREIKKMFESIGNIVKKLERTKIGNLDMEKLDLKLGECREVDGSKLII
ncbi:MAG: pseudouridine synthase [archaeon]